MSAGVLVTLYYLSHESILVKMLSTCIKLVGGVYWDVGRNMLDSIAWPFVCTILVGICHFSQRVLTPINA